MKSSKTFNNISAKLLKQIPKLKPGQSVVFKMLNGVPNPDPDEKERQKDPMLYPKVQLLTQYRIYDPYQKDESGEEVGGYVDVGCVDSWKGENPQAFRCFVAGTNIDNPTAAMPSRFQGKFELKAGNVKHEELYEIFWLSPQRKGSPCADASVEVIFEIQDTKIETTNTLNKVALLRKAMDEAADLAAGKNGGLKKARAILASYNKPNFTDDEVLKAKIQEFARDNYEQFLSAIENKDTDTKGEITEALAAGVLKHDLATGELTVGNVKIADLKVEGADKIVDSLVQWLNTAQNGKDVWLISANN
jgi:hypothetical protein